jgi:hypothetical protein
MTRYLKMNLFRQWTFTFIKDGKYAREICAL